MATTPTYGWETPDDTDLVKDGAAAIRTLGNAIDTTMATMVPKTIVDAKGDLIAATAADTVSRLAVGTNGQILTADSSTATGIKWATPASGGKVLQVVYGSTTTTVSSSSASYADTTLTATITPSASTSKVLVLVSQNGCSKSAANTNTGIVLKLLRGATDLAFLADNFLNTGTAQLMRGFGFSISVLDSPATTSATTYKTVFAEGNALASVTVQQSGVTSTMVLLEIGA